MDDYERRYMQPGEQVVFREKITSRAAFAVSNAFTAIFGIVGLALLAAGAAGTVPPAVGFGLGLTCALFAAFMGVTGVMFSVFRTMITGSNVHVHFGWAKRRIPLSAITSISAITLKGMRQGKVQVGFDGVVRTWVGTAPSGRGIELAYQEDGGRKHVLTLGSDEPERFVEAVERARACVRIGATDEERARVADETEVSAEEHPPPSSARSRSRL